jgi:hypothetical protein
MVECLRLKLTSRERYLADIDVRSVIDELFALGGVQRVVSIDDMNAITAPVEDALALTQKLPPADIKAIFANYPAVAAIDDLEIRLREVRKLWPNESDDTRRLLLNRLRAKAAEVESTGSQKNSTEVVDENTFSELPSLFAKYGLQLLSLNQWNDKQGEIITQTMPPTLFLVDEDFSKEEGGARFSGIAIIKAVMNAAPADRVLCALLTHNPRYQPETLHEAWKDLCQKQELDPSRFVLIPKKLIQDDPVGFARLVKLALLNGRVHQLKKTARDILHSAEENAHKRLNDIDIYDFDQIVFRSSRREGVWEPDTLFRVFGLFHQDETRKLAKKDAKLYAAADAIRALSLVPTKSHTAPNYNTIAIQRLELYETGEYLNAHFIPIDVGDIFQKTGDSDKRYILLAQSCDLMVRPDGKRNPFTNEAVLAEIVSGPIKDRDGHGELQFLDPDGGTQHFVSFKRTHSVKLSFLDICALNENGEAVLALEAPYPDRAIPAWKLHHEKLVKEFQKIIKQAEDLTKQGIPAQNAAALVARPSNSPLLTPTLDAAKKTVSFNLKRVVRLRQPRAAALLSRFANFMARQAFDHDFGDYDQPATPNNTDNVLQVPVALKPTPTVAVEAANPALPQQEPKQTSSEPERT